MATVKPTLIFLTSTFLLLLLCLSSSITAQSTSSGTCSPDCLGSTCPQDCIVALMRSECEKMFGKPSNGNYPGNIPPTQKFHPRICYQIVDADMGYIFEMGRSDKLVPQCMVGLIKFCGRKLY